MIRNLLLVLFLSWIIQNVALGQCITLGQATQSAFPVCGTTAFLQTSVPICSSQDLYVPGCSNNASDPYVNKNPFWYKFTCFQSGTLGFTITPNTSTDDYDWQLYDVTGHDVVDVYTNHSLVVTGNWSGSYGATGAASGGVNYIQCASSPSENTPSFAAMPNITIGHQYLLLISHYTDSQSGYSLAFGGGSASITDPKLPLMDKAEAPCDGSTVIVSLNKKMKCSSISSGEFTIDPPVATVTALSGNGCEAGFDMDKITLTLSNPLLPGTYQVKIKNGSDANTLLDNCERAIPENDSVQLVIAALEPTPYDSITTPGCAPQTLELVFRKRIRCNSFAANGTDFAVAGPYPVTVTGARGECADGLTYKIFVDLDVPLEVKGDFQIKLLDNLVDECGQITTPGGILPFHVKDTVSADFSYKIFPGCKFDTVYYFHDGRNEVNSWLWNFDDSFSSNFQNPRIVYNTFDTKHVELIVSNGVCSDTLSKDLLLNNFLKADFEADLLVCPDDPAKFKDLSVGNIINWSWNFANGNTSNVQNPPSQTYIDESENYYAPVQLIVEDNIGCRDTVRINLNILNNCYIAVPSAFTPNSDGLNDYLYPLNAYKAINLNFSVYNRLGQKVFFTTDWTNKWDGTFKGQGADPGTYIWTLDFYNTETHKHVFQKGSTVLIR